MRKLRPAFFSGVVLLAVALLAIGVHVAVGGTAIELGSVFQTLIGFPPDQRTALMIYEFRLPRTVAAITAGVGFGVAGALTQNVARNPLASPDILGVTNGAAAGAVAAMAAIAQLPGLPDGFSRWGMPVFAGAGGFLVTAIVFAVVWRSNLESNRLVLVGIGMSGLCAAITAWMLTLGEVVNAQQALTWMAGTVNGTSWQDLMLAPIAILICVLAAGLLKAQREVLALDADTARGLGSELGRDRLVLLVLATIMAVAATVVAGPLAFVALASGHAARILSRSIIPPVVHSALIGVIFVLLADLLAARLFSVALPAGVATAVIGAPYLMFLVVRQARARSTR
ncbi:iron ABC transporter permease [Glutamicibacter sp.]|uniref:FecCD family ABC transporter permease n=1 Tax=Glutamicibacter sp. TaxID=1931995 RepID=UPI0028BDF710|nr:iron ABC transporter permease [Glutamicibacter sp.]